MTIPYFRPSARANAILQTREIKEPQVLIIILNWNGKTLLQTCLTSLKEKTKYSNYSVIVIDNGSSDGSVEFVRKEFPWVVLIALEKNLGFASGNNKGINYALQKYDFNYILLLNNDTEIIQGDWLRKMVEVAESNEKIGVVGCKLVYPDGRIQYVGTQIDIKGLHWLKPNIANLSKVFEVDAVLGACFLIKREVLDKIGLLDERFSPFQQEESDYCVRARKAGYKVCMVTSVKIVHSLGTSIHQIETDYLELITKKNEIRFMLLNFPATWLIRRLPYEFRTFLLFCFLTRDNAKKRIIRKDWVKRTRLYTQAWLINLMNFREIIAKRARFQFCVA